MEFNEQLNQAFLKCKIKFIDLHFFEIYPFTTENISGYISKFDLNNKSLLTVGSSGDQAINAVLFNCKDISVVDVCPFTKFYFYLKKAALLTLSYEEFMDFFCYKNFSLFGDNVKSFNKSIFDKISKVLKELDHESYLFWKKLFSSYNSVKIRRNLFSSDEDSRFVLTRTNVYLKNDNAYKKTQSLIENVNPNFMIDNISNIRFDRKFNNIWLSNVGQYNSLNDLKKIIDKLDTNLNEDGKMLVCYLYKFVKETKYNKEWANIYNLEDVYKIFREYNLDLESFTGVNERLMDSVLIYKKTK